MVVTSIIAAIVILSIAFKEEIVSLAKRVSENSSERRRTLKNSPVVKMLLVMLAVVITAAIILGTISIAHNLLPAEDASFASLLLGMGEFAGCAMGALRLFHDF